ncbi:MAG: hypothetical protein JW751_12540 [Polyangiaceae bacterium]|nr:hypothetical protein [Polyangiaceae bacterium]
MNAGCRVGAQATPLLLFACTASLGGAQATGAQDAGSNAYRVECQVIDDCHEKAAEVCGQYMVIEQVASAPSTDWGTSGGTAAPGSTGEAMDPIGRSGGLALLVRCGHPDLSRGFHQQFAPGARWPSVTP